MSTEFCGTYILILHSHIPYVLHHDHLNEEWLYEATAETYIPLLNIMHRLIREGISPQITINISPVLAEQLISPYFVKGFQDYCDRKIRLSREDRKTFAAHNNSKMLKLATLWDKFYSKTLRLFLDRYQGNIIQAFRQLQDDGHIEIITCGATHGYLPALGEDTSINAQIKMAKASYERLFGRAPKGFWLPECGYRPAGHWVYPLTHRRNQPARYRPGIEQFLGENGILYSIIDQEQLRKSPSPQVNKIPWNTYCLPDHGMHTPMTLFVRDTNLSEQIWNFEIGYPGDGNYLEFHKKQWGSGNRYWRITDKKLDLAYKDIYVPETARELIIRHAGHYKWTIKKTLKSQFLKTAQAGLKVAAFDAELFGHWWFEGPAWLYQLLKWIHHDPEMRITTCSAYQAEHPSSPFIELPESSWGRGADSSTWINPAIEWVWERIYQAEKDMRDLANRFPGRKPPLLRRILRQCVRELLILQSSDWEFMITTNSTKDHGERRVVEHHEDFKRLVQLALSWEQNRKLDPKDLAFLKECEAREEIFADPDPDWYR
ncbi:MAG: DUF1957 domain-containing protein [bacterium]|nr:DUF1957 domain-containing protein [bacterium]